MEQKAVNGVCVIRLETADLADQTGLLLVGEAFKELLGDAGAGPPRVVVSLQSVDHIFTTALSKLASFSSKVLGAGGKVCLCGVRPQVRNMIAITHLEELFLFSETESEAVALVR